MAVVEQGQGVVEIRVVVTVTGVAHEGHAAAVLIPDPVFGDAGGIIVSTRPAPDGVKDPLLVTIVKGIHIALTYGPAVIHVAGADALLRAVIVMVVQMVAVVYGSYGVAFMIAAMAVVDRGHLSLGGDIKTVDVHLAVLPLSTLGFIEIEAE